MSGNSYLTDASASVPAYAGLAVRVGNSALMMQAGGLAFSAQSGMRPGAQPSVGIAGSAVTIQPFACIVDPGSSQGPYLCSFVASEPVTLNAAPGVGTSRIDGLDVQVPTDPVTGGIRVANVVYTPGTAAASPSAPAIPARSIRIGTVLVPNSGAATYTPTSTFSVAAGGVLPFPLTASPPANPFDGQVSYDQQANAIAVYNGASWDYFYPSNPPTWTAFTGFSAGASAGTPTPQWSKDSGTGLVRWRGQINASTNFAPSGVTIISSMPAAIVPSGARLFSVATNFASANHPARLNANTGGDMQFFCSTSDTITFFSLDGINYFV